MNAVQTYNQGVQQVNQDLKVIKRGGAVYDEFLRKINQILEKLESAFYFYTSQKAELVKEKEKKDEFMGSLKKYLKDQNDKMKLKNETVESFTNMARTTLTSMKFKTLGKVKRDAAVENLFRFLYVNLYNEQDSTFAYEQFVKVALGREIGDLQTRLAIFSVGKLTPEGREQLSQIKNADYSANQGNEDLYFLLEWLEYNYEAFLALKDRDQSTQTIRDTKDKEKKYDVQIKASALILADIDNLLQYTDINLNHLRLYKRKFEEAKEIFARNSNSQNLAKKMANIFKSVDGFQGNEVVKALDFQINQ